MAKLLPSAFITELQIHSQQRAKFIEKFNTAEMYEANEVGLQYRELSHNTRIFHGGK
jgi:hypothetical protein